MRRERYRRRLDRLEDALVATGDLVRDQFAAGFGTLLTGDEAVAKEVIDRDREVNRRSLAIERECLDVIRLHQPVASDLRVVVAAFKIVTDLERVGDLATNLAEYALRATPEIPAVATIDVDIERIGALAVEQLEDAIEAFVAGDATAPPDIARRDDELDERCGAATERVLRRLLETTREGTGDRGAEPSPERTVFAAVSRTLLVIRDLERVGDHAVNVAGRTLYALEGDDRLLA